MHKKVRPNIGAFRALGTFPHCDQRVLHAPGECRFCDQRRDLQEIRVLWGIAFTGYVPEGLETPCPATMLRPLEKIEAWPGNRAVTGEGH